MRGEGGKVVVESMMDFWASLVVPREGGSLVVYILPPLFIQHSTFDIPIYLPPLLFPFFLFLFPFHQQPLLSSSTSK